MTSATQTVSGFKDIGTFAVEAARGARTDPSLANKKSPAGSAGLFDSGSPDD
jgi:hypothetical protein